MKTNISYQHISKRKVLSINMRINEKTRKFALALAEQFGFELTNQYRTFKKESNGNFLGIVHSAEKSDTELLQEIGLELIVNRKFKAANINLETLYNSFAKAQKFVTTPHAALPADSRGSFIKALAKHYGIDLKIHFKVEKGSTGPTDRDKTPAELATEINLELPTPRADTSHVDLETLYTTYQQVTACVTNYAEELYYDAIVYALASQYKITTNDKNVADIATTVAFHLKIIRATEEKTELEELFNNVLVNPEKQNLRQLFDDFRAAHPTKPTLLTQRQVTLDHNRSEIKLLNAGISQARKN